MAHRRHDWLNRIKSAYREYQVIRIALDSLEDATEDEIHALEIAREWDDSVRLEINKADSHLAGTYLIRMYSVFEMAIDSFWRQLPGNWDRKAEGDVKLDDIGNVQGMVDDVVKGAQAVRSHRNRVVHQSIERHAGTMAIEDAKRDLLVYLDRLPITWG